MKNSDLLILAAAGLAAWLILRRGTAAPAAQTAAGTHPAGWTSELNILNDGGWRYFDDGTAIGPDGAYYSGGVKVWTPQ